MPWLREFLVNHGNQTSTQLSELRNARLAYCNSQSCGLGPNKIFDSNVTPRFPSSSKTLVGSLKKLAPDPSAGRVSATLGVEDVHNMSNGRVWDWNKTQSFCWGCLRKKKAIIRFGSHSSIGTHSTIPSMNKKQAKRGRTHQNLCLTSFKTGPRHGAGFFLGGNTMSSIVQCDSHSPKSCTFWIILGNPKLINWSKLISNQANKLFLETCNANHGILKVFFSEFTWTFCSVSLTRFRTIRGFLCLLSDTGDGDMSSLPPLKYQSPASKRTD